ncbi:MAG: bifunctional 5,10-methylenetetrahydrofolate dehydrogenase/5,10-methenyltetrahydrofolate cyclohydrolase [Methylacidiphilales bacterium]|nr:bifunctional 5,10-methylenetetrahydrofolate dehydrogenase/5,10-methenyltetrahydrofolate cyclohydrolase [Candidatus Methylacidiphilales bacterium]MDW8349899.1 bifunctional 5,10-methylenetetrahydrofolate dehydrogenase/5,10-methenyltetrahydrofolate cyclohydrolase [Verrucomicrobiae bacterium]
MGLPLILDGRRVASEVEAELAVRLAKLRARHVVPRLVFIRVGDDPASIVYVEMKNKKAALLGIQSDTVVLPQDTSEEALVGLIGELNADSTVHGILVQAPLPPPIRSTRIFASVAPHKDVDGFHPINMGKLLLGDPTGFRPCTPAGIYELLVRNGISTAGRRVAIIGRGAIVGKPMAAILMQKGIDATVTLLHSGSRSIDEHCRQSEIIIAALGRAHFVTKDFVSPGAVVIDVGVNRQPDSSSPRGYRLVGDVDFENVAPLCSAITPNPGGVGPMTIAMLMANVVCAAEKATDKSTV